MTYASLEDLVERAGAAEILQIADRDGDDIADPAVVEAALVHADNIVNGFVAVKYQMPLASVPDLVRTWAVSIARYYLHRYERPDYVVQDYKDAIRDLTRVSEGKLALPDAAGLTPTASEGGSVHASHPRPHFDPRGYLS